MDETEKQPVSSRPERDLSAVPEQFRPYAYKPGQSGNPGGRPKGCSITAELRRVLNEGLDGVNVAEALMKVAVKKAEKGDFRFWNAIVERTDGPVKQIVEFTGDDQRRAEQLARAMDEITASSDTGGPVEVPDAVRGGDGGAALGQDRIGEA